VTQLLALIGVIVVAAMSPGPDSVVVLRNAAVSGRRAGMACGAGIASGILVWATVTALGVAGLLAASAVAFTVVKLVGAGYLVLLGIRSLLTARRGGYEALDTSGASVRTVTRTMASAFRQGLLTNLLNPKVAIFFIALLPQFTPTTASMFDHVLLALIAATVSLVWFVVLSNVVSAMRRFLTSGRARRVIDAVMGSLLVGLGVRVAVSS
jgi:RhtB (resistance to homoserine/threonine) family protein